MLRTDDQLRDLQQKEEWGEDDYDYYTYLLQRKYSFFVTNPPAVGVEYSLWINEGGREYPMLSSNTGGRATFYSADEEFGDDAIEPSEQFFLEIATEVHQALSFTPRSYFEFQFEDSVDHWMEDLKMADHEVWAATKIIPMVLQLEGKQMEEIRPIAEFADRFTEFNVMGVWDE